MTSLYVAKEMSKKQNVEKINKGKWLAFYLDINHT